jgi:hypothetical protein
VVDIFNYAGSDIKGALALSYTTVFAHNVGTPAIFHLLFEMLKLSYEQLAFLSYNSIYSVDTSHVKVKQM